MDPNNSFSGKVCFTLIDKVFIGIMAGAVAFFFQYQQYKSQMLLNATIAASKISTDIITKQREKLVTEVGDYILLLEQIKSTGKANDKQINELASHRHKINFTIETLGAVDSNIETVAKTLLKSINDLNHGLARGTVGGNSLKNSINKILAQYMKVLEIIQITGICKTVEEFQTASKQTKEALKRKFLSRQTDSPF